MKQKSRFSVLITRVLSFAMAVLGFSACSSFGDEPLDMYGSPTIKYSVKGKVVDSENKESGLQGIQVLVRPNIDNYYYADTLLTNEKGEFSVSKSGSNELQVRLIYEDKTNGVFKKDSLTVDMERIKEGSGAWDLGTYEADVTIEMEKKTEEKEEE